MMSALSRALLAFRPFCAGIKSILAQKGRSGKTLEHENAIAAVPGKPI
jgi:hypothetical protein